MLVVDIAAVHNLEGVVQELNGAFLRLLLVALPLCLAGLKQLCRLRVLRHEHIAHMARKSHYQVAAIEALRQHTVEEQHNVGHLVLKGEVYDVEIIVNVEDVQVFEYLLVGDVPLTEARRLVEDGQGITHTSIGLLGN